MLPDHTPRLEKTQPQLCVEELGLWHITLASFQKSPWGTLRIEKPYILPLYTLMESLKQHVELTYKPF